MKSAESLEAPRDDVAPASRESPAHPSPRTPSFVRGMRAAFVFLTRVPVGGFPYARADWSWATAHFPLVGLVLGAALGGTFVLLRPVGALPAAALTIGLSLLVTGAFHEDGLADTSDALGGAYDRENVLRILKDSRVGSFGAVALCFSFVTRAALLAELHGSRPVEAIGAVALVGSLARAVPLWQMVRAPYATEQGSKSRDVVRAEPSRAAIGTGYPLVLGGVLAWCGVLSPLRLVAAAIACLVVGAVTEWRYRRRVGGITGDFLGATEQLCEIAIFAVLVWRS
ncbi:Cobalamin synthase [Labilithrix luteola]|uniref:Adenosylcobinamide-GDP ribazoletransferase n=1 Tax=Labilithrix luteola TaxID=1391654 RepID=A0A0K1Q910_9BACT|nr:adenosylcobinamide-GDP ribazoletransferase [Labilithrix luteola]AKV02214.1 Cobalamin synthase [Labilithrix luteola]